MCVTCGLQDWRKIIRDEEDSTYQALLDLRAHQVLEDALKDHPRPAECRPSPAPGSSRATHGPVSRTGDP